MNVLMSEKSTIVRSYSGKLRALRTGFAVLDRLNPRLAGAWALRLWCTLPTGSGRRQDNRPFPGRRDTVDLGDARDVAVETWDPETSSTAGPVYLVHGWGGWRGQLGAFVDPLLLAGHRVVAFDAPSHGDSSPSALGRGRATAVDFIDALTAVAHRFGPAAGIVAHSLGAATTTVAVHDGLRARRLVYVAPGPNPLATTARLENLLGYGPRTRAYMRQQLHQLAQRPLDDFNALTIASSADLPSALIVHDRQDKESPYDDGVALARRWPNAELLTTDGLGHQRILLDTTVLKSTTDYLTIPAQSDEARHGS